MDFPHNSVGKESACNAGDLGSIPGPGRSPGEGNGNPFQYSYLENPMDRGAWWATVHGVLRVGQHLATKPPPQGHSALSSCLAILPEASNDFLSKRASALFFHLNLRSFNL